MKSKTIFIALFQGVEAKNILRTNIYKELIKNDWLRIILFVDSKSRADYYRKEFSHPRVMYEVVDRWAPKGLDKIFSILKFFTLKTKTTKLRRRMALEDRGKTLRAYTVYCLGVFFNILLSNKITRKIIRWLDFNLIDNRRYKKYFDKYNPDLVFLSHLFDETEIDILREAKKQKVRSIGFINSWDKLTARCSLRLLPDKLVVFNEIVKREALKHTDMKEKDIMVTGLPQYDIYEDRAPISKGEFFEKMNLSLDKKLLVYAPMGKAFSNSDWDIIDLFRKAIKKEDIKGVQLLVRFSPNDFIDEDELEKRPDLKYDLPGTRFSKKRGVNWDMNFQDINHLHDTIFHLDVLVCYTSSMSIDVAVLGKPVINIDFEVKEKKITSKTPTFYYQTTHYSNAIRTGGISRVKNKKELINQINNYLENPKLKKEGRKKLVKEQCWKVDGKAGQRIADFLISNL